MMRAISFYISIILIFSCILFSCEKREGKPIEQNKIKVVTTLFPLYDFATNICHDKAEVSLLLPPGVEAHAYEPKPADMSKIQNADIFIYTGAAMEPWVEKLLQGIDTRRINIIDASRGITLISGLHRHDNIEKTGFNHDHESRHPHEHQGGPDPHIWLDFSNAGKMVDTIAKGFMDKDPQNQIIYSGNAEAYKRKLEDLDKKYRDSLSSCKSRIIIHAGHFAFGYLTKRYNIEYITAYKGFTPDAEPTPKSLIELMKTLKKYSVKTIYYEELIIPRVADTISKEVGGNMLMLHGAHNISKAEMDQGVSFLSLMEKNLENLRIGMQCP
jgi:zinc transport system substrate-binding protein